MKYIFAMLMLSSMSSYGQEEALRTVYLKNGEEFDIYNWRMHDTEYEKIIFYLNSGPKRKSEKKEYVWNEVDSFTDGEGGLNWVLKYINSDMWSLDYVIRTAYSKRQIVYNEVWVLQPQGGTQLYYQLYSYEIGYWSGSRKIGGRSKKSTKNREILKRFFGDNEVILSEIDNYDKIFVKPKIVKEWVRRAGGKITGV